MITENVNVQNIMDKFNLLKKNRKSENFNYTIADVMVKSSSEWIELSKDVLTKSEQDEVFEYAEEERKNNLLTNSQVLSRKTPLLSNLIKQTIQHNSLEQNYTKIFGSRSSEFAPPGSIASMFSPASYLTEMYRETRDLHPSDSIYNVDYRRPDLSELTLSQQNLDEEISTLKLSNELLMNIIQKENNLNQNEIFERLSTYRETGKTPFHYPYEVIRQSIKLQDENFTAFINNPDITSKIDTATLNAIRSNISPELYNILVEDLSAGEVKDHLLNNFGNTEISAFKNVAYLARYYGLSEDEIKEFLGEFVIENDFNTKEEYYYNDQLITVSEAKNSLSSRLLRRVYGINGNQFGYAELLPVSGNNYIFRFTTRSGPSDSSVRIRIGTTGAQSSNIVHNQHILRGHGVQVSVPVTFNDDVLSNGVTIGLTRYTSTGFFYATVDFRQERTTFPLLLLKLNKLIRLYCATGVSPRNIRTVLDSVGSNMKVTESTIKQLFWINQYIQHYSIDRREAMVLSNANISLISYKGESSDFDLLFNTPQLNKEYFSADSSIVNFKPDSITDTFRTGVLKRAFQINDTELYTLWSLVQGTPTPPVFTCNLDNISALYRIYLVAKIHHISISQLSMFISLPPFVGNSLGKLSREQLAEVMMKINLCIEWLNSRRISLNELYLMTTSHFDTSVTPEMNNLITTLQNGLANHSNPENEASYISTAASLLAAAAQLDSDETAIAVMDWIDKLKPSGLSVTQFLKKIKNFKIENDNNQLVSFCHKLAQLILIVRTLRLSAEEINYAISNPRDFQPDSPELTNTLMSVQNLGRFQSWLQKCGQSAMDVLASLGNRTLSPSQLAKAMGENEQMLLQALSQQNLSNDIFNGWRDVNITLQWMNISQQFGITPSGISELISLEYKKGTGQPYNKWNQISNIILAGLDEKQSEKLHLSLEASVSESLSAYVIKNITPEHVVNRNDLYSWFLLDNQVSAEVKTTRLAEAIASLQLYINRALNGQEQGINNTVRNRRFFTEWDMYNKRYSTWAGLSQLVYYPENYINPIMRIGQTGMMDEMLQTISQSQLTSDAVENAFNTYMTRFEEIANLHILSGYHDDLTSQTGLMYLIGFQSTTGKYYWRKLDHNKEQYGQFPANAWSEWKEITVAAQPSNNQIRAVIFNSRLYLVWIEKRNISSDSGQNNQATYELRYSFIRHDGTWSIVSMIPLNEVFSENEIENLVKINLYCTRDSVSGNLIVILYTPQSTSENNKNAPMLSMVINNQHLFRKNNAILKDQLWPYFDTINTIKVSQLYAPPQFVASSIPLNYGWGDHNITIMSGGRVGNVRLSSSQTEVRLLVDVDVRVVYNGLASTPIRTQVNLMKQFGNMGDRFYIYKTMRRNPDWNTSGRLFTAIYRMGIANWSGQLLINRTVVNVNSPRLDVWLPDPPMALHSTSGNLNISIPQTQIQDSIFINRYIFINDSTHSATDVFDGYVIQTNINPQDVRVNATVANVTTTFNAQTHINSSELPELNFDGTVYHFRNLELNVPFSAFVNDRANINLDLIANATDGRTLGRQSGTLTVSLVKTENGMDILQGEHGEQYLQKGTFRTRLNTLFARSLVERANKGLNAVLSMETQVLEEPKLGEGNYVDVRFSRYSQTLHGDGWFRLFLVGATETGTSNRSRDLVATGRVSDTEETTVRLYLPRNPKIHERNRIYIGVEYSDVDLSGTFLTMQDFTYNPEQRRFIPATNNATNRTRGLRSFIVDQQSEPMDFRGANALYFWEMFYYVPMMVFKRLLDESCFTEATKWIKFIWNPEGYLIEGKSAPYQWNVRPLEEDISWNSNPLDTVDPDAVAQADPMHYKLAVFMSWIDLLIARGDTAYRKLERDTLNEAKMWYVQALSMLGDKPFLSLADISNWRNPTLGDAADRVRQVQMHKSLLQLRANNIAIDSFSSNSNVDLFLPQFNEMLINYWDTLEQRLFNLRNNLSIDGQPLSLPIFSLPASPNDLQSAAVTSFRNGSNLPVPFMSVYRFPVILRSARDLTRQLSYFGLTLLSLIERQDDSALSVLLHTHGIELIRQVIGLQDKTIEEIDADRLAMLENLRGAQNRLNHYTNLWNENINVNENAAMGLSIAGSLLSTTAIGPYTVAGILDTAPNIYGMAFGGMDLGAIAKTVGGGIELVASSMHSLSDAINQSETFRRRHQEWEIQKEDANYEVKEFEAHLNVLKIRREAAVMQKRYLEKEFSLLREQEEFIDGQFSGVALYSWLRGRLSAIYRQFYDLTVSRCLMVEEAYRLATGNNSARFIRPGAWQGTQAGLMAADSLNLNLTQMEHSYLSLNEREKEVTRNISLTDMFNKLSNGNSFIFSQAVSNIIKNNHSSVGSNTMGLRMENGLLLITIRLSELNIMQDYPLSLGNKRRIRSISVTLASQKEYHHDIRAVLNYGGSVILPQGCNAQVVSHGKNDSGQFNLNFNDERWLPFEGIPVNDSGTLTLSFPDAGNKQSELLQSLSDIILHIRYTIIS